MDDFMKQFFHESTDDLMTTDEARAKFEEFSRILHETYDDYIRKGFSHNQAVLIIRRLLEDSALEAERSKKMLKIIQVGHDDASDRYIRNKVKAIEEAGMKAEVINLPYESKTHTVISTVLSEGVKHETAAIIVQLPLPDHIDKEEVLKFIPTSKDIDGLNPKSDYKPLTPCAIMRWLDEQNVDLTGKKVAIFGRSELVGKPLANMMIDAGATVTVLNSRSNHDSRVHACYNADILVSAVGKENTIGWNDVERMNFQPIVIDVGINRDADGKLCGDVSIMARESIEPVLKGICTPVPGGVGKWTVRELVLRLKEMENNNELSKSL